MFKRCIGIMSLVFISIVLISGVSFAGQWAKAYGGTGREMGSIWPIGDGNYYLGGSTTSFGAGKTDGLMAKLTATGAVSWTKTFGGPEDDYLDVMDLSDGGFFVSGSSYSFGTGNPATPNSNIVFAKFNSLWAPVFQKVLGGDRDEWATFTKTNDKGFLFLGSSNSYGASASDNDMLLFKITSAGGLTWEKAFHYSLEDRVWDVVELSDGFLVAAVVYDKLSTDQDPIADILLMKLNKTTGAVIWNKLLSYANSSLGNIGETKLFKLIDGNYLVSSSLQPVTNPNWTNDILLVKITPAGEVLAAKTCSSSTADISVSAGVANVLTNADGSLIVSGGITATDLIASTSKSSALAMKLNADLSIVWQKKFSSTGEVFRSMIERTGPGEIILSGLHSAKSFTSPYDTFYAKLNPTTFAPVWANVFSGTRQVQGWIEKANTNYLLSGFTESYGGATATTPNIFGIILDANGNYPNCNVTPFTLNVGNPKLAMAPISLKQTVNFSLTKRTPDAPTPITLTKKSPTLPVKKICPSIAAPQSETLEEPEEEFLDIQQDAE